MSVRWAYRSNKKRVTKMKYSVSIKNPGREKFFGGIRCNNKREVIELLTSESYRDCDVFVVKALVGVKWLDVTEGFAKTVARKTRGL